MVSTFNRVWINQRYGYDTNLCLAARGKLKRKCVFLPVPVSSCPRIWYRETGSTAPSRVSPLILPRSGQVRSGQVRSGQIIRLNLMLTHGVPPAFRDVPSCVCVVNHHRASLEFIGPRNCVLPTRAFTTESPLAQGQ